MSRPIEPTPELDADEFDRLLDETERNDRAVSDDEMRRRIAVARARLARQGLTWPVRRGRVGP